MALPGPSPSHNIEVDIPIDDSVYSTQRAYASTAAKVPIILTGQEVPI